MYWWLVRNRNELFRILGLIAFPCILFFTFYLKWIHLEFDVGREMYQAFAIATQDKTLYTDLTHYFGPLAPYCNAFFLKLFGASIFTFSLIGLVLVVASGLLLYFIGKAVLSESNSFYASILFLSLSSINIGGGSFFMPYSYSHSYGIVLTLLSLYILQKLVVNYSVAFQLQFNLCLSLLLFTKQEYILVYIGFQMMYCLICIQNHKSNILKIGLVQVIASLSLAFIGHQLLFIDYSVMELWESSRNMFQQHNSGILKNFLMLYSPSTIKLAIYSFIPFLLIVSLIQVIKQFQIKWLFIALASSVCIAFTYNVICQEWLSRGFLFNWFSLLLSLQIGYQILSKKRKIDLLTLILATSLLLYNRQQSAAWMWQGLNMIILLYLIQKVTDYLKNPVIKPILISVLTLSSISVIPLKLNQTWGAVIIKSKSGESIPVKKEWAEPIQKTVNYLDSLPTETTLYTGQETAWLNVLTHRHNDIRNQQWWGYMADGIVSDINESPPDYIVLSYYKNNQIFKLYSQANLIWESISSKYDSVKTIKNESIQFEIYTAILK